MSKNKTWLCLAVLLVLTAAGALKYGTESVGKMNIQTAGELSDEEHPKIALTFDDGPSRGLYAKTSGRPEKTRYSRHLFSDRQEHRGK